MSLKASCEANGALQVEMENVLRGGISNFYEALEKIAHSNPHTGCAGAECDFPYHS
jgi:hypothetical protein